MRDRPLDQPRHLVEQPGIVLEREPLARRRRLGLLLDLGAPLGGIEDHEGGAQLVAVVGEARHVEARRREKTMSDGLIVCDESRVDFHTALVAVAVRKLLESKREAELKFPPIEHGKNILQRPNPARLVVRPFHRLRPRQTHQGSGNRDTSGLRRRLAGDAVHEHPGLALAVAALLAVVQRTTATELAQEALHRLLGRTDARALDLLDALRRRGGQAVDDEREAPRRDVGVGAGPAQSRGLEPVGDQLLEILGRARLHARGDLLAQQLDQQLSHVPLLSRAAR
jgi:hypothetical protein